VRDDGGRRHRACQRGGSYLNVDDEALVRLTASHSPVFAR
jgi:hypothetical protein